MMEVPDLTHQLIMFGQPHNEDFFFSLVKIVLLQLLHVVSCRFFCASWRSVRARFHYVLPEGIWRQHLDLL